MKRYAAIWAFVRGLDSGGAVSDDGATETDQSIPLPNVEGYFDHMAVDVKGQRLFVPGEHQRTIEVVDLRAGKVIHTITGFGGDPRRQFICPRRTKSGWTTEMRHAKRSAGILMSS